MPECFAETLDSLFCRRFAESCSSELGSSLEEIKNEDDFKTVIYERSFAEYEVRKKKISGKKVQCSRDQNGKTA